MLIVFSAYKGAVHDKCTKQGQNINQYFYLQVLRCLYDKAHY
jgi:hypothetical protein